MVEIHLTKMNDLVESLDSLYSAGKMSAGEYVTIGLLLRMEQTLREINGYIIAKKYEMLNEKIDKLKDTARVGGMGSGLHGFSIGNSDDLVKFLEKLVESLKD